MAIKAKVYNLEGKSVKEVELPKDIFEVELSPVLVSKVVVAQAANQRRATAKTKTRSERRGGGIKPWKQKGTGRARHGSIRSPLWRKGGVIWGPRPGRNYKKETNAKERRLSLMMVLSAKAKEKNGLVILDNLNLAEAKTKLLAQALKKLPVGHKTILIPAKKDEKLLRASRNLPYAQTVVCDYLDTLQVASVDTLIMPEECIIALQKRLTAKVVKTEKAKKVVAKNVKAAAPVEKKEEKVAKKETVKKEGTK